MIYTVYSNSYTTYIFDMRTSQGIIKLKLSNLERGNTYITVLCLNNGYTTSQQITVAKLLEESKDIKILYKSPLAVNKNPNHGKHGRNCTYVFYYPTLCELSEAGAPDVKSEGKIVAETTSTLGQTAASIASPVTTMSM